MPDGGFLNIKLMGDSTKTALDGSRVDYCRIHTSDTASMCLGLPDSATTIRYLDFEPTPKPLRSIQRNVFRENHQKWMEEGNLHSAVFSPAEQDGKPKFDKDSKPKYRGKYV
jgi:hypothetical protein